MKHIYSIVNFNVKAHSSDAFTAASKAREDINSIAENYGLKDFDINICQDRGNLVAQLTIMFALFRILFKVDGVIIQYPPLKGLKMLHIVNNFFGRKIVYLVHDIEFLRFGKNPNSEIYNLNKADGIISHTPNMTDALRKAGCTKQIVNLYLFDYLSSQKNLSKSVEDQSVVFAGNLKKSKFLENLKMIPDVRFSLYGIFFESKMGGGNVEYKGKFQPEDVNALNGKYGLVWDGDSIDSCSGSYGNYLHYNSSHKISLYIRANLPIIVWSESSLAEFVKEKKIGIVVDSLRHLGVEINKIGEDDYAIFKHNVFVLSEKLSRGEQFWAALQKMDSKI